MKQQNDEIDLPYLTITSHGIPVAAFLSIHNASKFADECNQRAIAGQSTARYHATKNPVGSSSPKEELFQISIYRDGMLIHHLPISYKAAIERVHEFLSANINVELALYRDDVIKTRPIIDVNGFHKKYWRTK